VDPRNLEDTDFYPVCMACGAVQSDMGIRTASAVPSQAKASGSASYYQTRKKDKDGKVIPGRVCYGPGPRRRYKREFYYRERLAQWTCDEPALKSRVMDKFYNMLWSGSYGCNRYLTKGDVLQMCKDAKLCKYKENWKSVLVELRGRDDPYPRPDSELVDVCSKMFSVISKRFDRMSKSEMSRYLKGSKGKNRHHILHVNYIHRKILESLGIYEYHREFPLLRTPAKIHALDDVMQQICHQLEIPFTRTAVVLAPKCKNRFKKRAI
jgi:hypothetical protein